MLQNTLQSRRGYGLYPEDSFASDYESKSESESESESGPEPEPEPEPELEYVPQLEYKSGPSTNPPVSDQNQLLQGFGSLRIDPQIQLLVLHNRALYNKKTDQESLQKLQSEIVESLRQRQVKALENEIFVEIQAREKIIQASTNDVRQSNLAIKQLHKNIPSTKISSQNNPVDSDVANALQKVSDLKNEFSQKLKDIEKKKKLIKEKEEHEAKQREIVIAAAQKKPEIPKQIAEPLQSSPDINPIDKTSKTISSSDKLPTVELEPTSASTSTTSVSTATATATNNRQVSKSETSLSDSDEKSMKLASRLAQINSTLGPLIKKNPQFKKYCFDSKRKINLKVGQLTNDALQINQSIKHIDSILTDASKVDSNVYQWLLNLTAKSLVSQAETEVAVKITVCYPLAHTTVSLLQSHPLLVEFLLVRLNKKCPYVYPRVIFKKLNESDLDFKQRLCFRKSSGSDEFESIFKYQERMSGIIAYYAAIIQTTPKVGLNPLPIYHGWLWLSKIVNLPIADVYPAIITTFIEISGIVMEAAYKNQFSKILTLLKSQYTDYARKELPSSISSISRLESVLQRYFTNPQKFQLASSRNPQ